MRRTAQPVVEYEGEQIRGMAKEIEKAQLDRLRVESSAGRRRFSNMSQQLDAALA